MAIEPTELNKKYSKYVWLAMCAVFLVIAVFSYYHIFVKNDFWVVKQIPCDPQTEACFVSECESNDPNCDTTEPYKKIKVPSKYAGSDFNSLNCQENSSNCEIVTCQEDTVDAGERCFE